MELNKIYNENCLDTMARMTDGLIDLTVTSPPYDNLRQYNGYSFQFEDIAKELYRVTKKGGVLVWVVSDATYKGSETGSSFKQALFFKQIGFNLFDTMIYMKNNPIPTDPRIGRYVSAFEYMFILSKGRPKTTNLLTEKTKYGGIIINTTVASQLKKNGEKRADRALARRGIKTKEDKIKKNIFSYNVAGTNYGHPAIFPEQLAADHIYSWSNEGDIVYDPFSGSGTTLKMAHIQKRKWIGSEISKEYFDISQKRLFEYLGQITINYCKEQPEYYDAEKKENIDDL